MDEKRSLPSAKTGLGGVREIQGGFWVRFLLIPTSLKDQKCNATRRHAERRGDTDKDRILIGTTPGTTNQARRTSAPLSCFWRELLLCSKRPLQNSSSSRDSDISSEPRREDESVYDQIYAEDDRRRRSRKSRIVAGEGVL